MSIRKAGLRPKRSAAGPPSRRAERCAKNQCRTDQADHQRAESKPACDQRHRHAEQKMEKPSSSVPPLARSQMPYCRRPIGALSSRT